MTIHLPSLLHPILTPVLHLKHDPLVTPLPYLDLCGDHVLRLEPKRCGGAEPSMLDYVHIINYSPKDASLVTLELESQVV